MIPDQARKLRILAEQRRLLDQEDVSPARHFSLRSIVLFSLAALVVILVLFFHYSNQRYVLEIMSEKNQQLEERMLLLSVQLENLKTSIDANIRENYVLKQEVASLAGERDTALREGEKSVARMDSLKQDFGQLQKELDKLKAGQVAGSGIFSREIKETLDALDRKAEEMTSRLEQVRERASFPLQSAPLGSVAFFKEDYSFVVLAHAAGTSFREGQYLAVHRGEKRLAILKIIEVRGTVSAAVVEELWSPIEKGDQVKHL